MGSHMTFTGQKKFIEMIYLPERKKEGVRDESFESTSPVKYTIINYEECASRPYLS